MGPQPGLVHAAGKTFSSDDKITAVYRQFLLDNDWQQQANHLTLSSASTLLLTHLIQHYSNVQWRLPTVTGGLAPHVLRNLLAWIEENLDQPLTCRSGAGSGVKRIPFCADVSPVDEDGAASVRYAAPDG